MPIKEGLKVIVSTDEVRSMLLERAEYHSKRAVEKSAQLPKLREACEAIQAGADRKFRGGNSTSYGDLENEVDRLEREIATHNEMIRGLKFTAEHLPPATDFELRVSDDICRELGMNR